MDITNLKYVQVPMVVLTDVDISSTAKLLMGLITTLRRNNYLKIDNEDSARKIYLASIF